MARREKDRPSSRAGEMAHATRPPAHRPGDGEPYLGSPLRYGNREDTGKFRQGQRGAYASRIARLAGYRVRTAGLEHQIDAPADVDFERLPSEFGCHAHHRKG